ncbi:hypothetical protein AKJ51_00750 [candidate division MSBL1 archaeon SCGC-AAA382A20]|uniref:Uncharacterized protein n=1 Tax=candidate division MSBL1 archaeon SCGC-AAA382A20 TaxID=1698280 RepID=A0A133VMI4_9EURY|nr:hypothetical protein AKJ51_00750 [candidate division MSBL1 archaeon SCGC-AAA382A20]
METDMENKLEEYLELLEKIKKQVGNEDTAASIVGEIGKDRRVEKMHEKNGNNGNGSAATEKQKAFMEKLGIDYPENVTKREASGLIDEELAKNGKQ